MTGMNPKVSYGVLYPAYAGYFDLQVSVVDDLQVMHSVSETWVSLALEFHNKKAAED
jgi:hypothetical protein